MTAHRLILIFLIACTQSIYTQSDLFNNLDFSQKTSDSLSTQAYWQSKDFVNISSVKHKKDYALEISGSYDMNQVAYVYQQHPIQLNDYKLFRVEAKVRSKDLVDGYGGIYCYTKQGEEWLAYKDMGTMGVTGNSKWTSQSLLIWLSPEADILRIGASMSGTGSIQIDDFSITEVDPSSCKKKEEWQGFMDECMDLIAKYSLHKNEIDTSALMKTWQRQISCSDNKNDLHQGLEVVLRQIDKHSFFWSAEQVQLWENTSQSSQNSIIYSKGHHIDSSYAYIWMPHFNSGDSVSHIQFANHLQSLIDSLDHPKIKGWVLDLRDNQGGNCWPMLAGIGPILGDGVCGYFQSHDTEEAWSYSGGISYNQGIAQTSINQQAYTPYDEKARVAVLIGPMTASSGEVVTVAFKNRPKSLLFGQKTAAYSTGNANYTLSDGSMLFLAGSVYADREKVAYPKGIEPDVLVEDDPETPKDEVLEAAVEWLKAFK